MLEALLDEEDGAQVVEYALIIALVSIGLVVALQPAVIAESFNSFIGKVQTCLDTPAECV